jgi:Type II secretion system protein C
MQANFFKIRRVAWISIPAAAGLILSFYYGSRSEPSPAQAAGPASESAATSITGRTATGGPALEAIRNAAPRATWSESKLVVNGVVIAPASKGALISLGDQPARLVAEGDTLVDGVVLRAVNPNFVVVERGGELQRFPVLGGASASNGPSALPDVELDSTDPPVPIPPLGTEERRAYQSQNRD